MQSHAHVIQAILARELDMHARQVALVQASLLTAPPAQIGDVCRRPRAGLPLGLSD